MGSSIDFHFGYSTVNPADSLIIGFRAEGSKYQGQSHAYINASLNGIQVVQCYQLGSAWTFYYLRSSSLMSHLVSGDNVFRIEIDGSCAGFQTPPWISFMETDAWASSGPVPGQDRLAPRLPLGARDLAEPVSAGSR